MPTYYRGGTRSKSGAMVYTSHTTGPSPATVSQQASRGYVPKTTSTGTVWIKTGKAAEAGTLGQILKETPAAKQAVTEIAKTPEGEKMLREAGYRQEYNVQTGELAFIKGGERIILEPAAQTILRPIPERQLKQMEERGFVPVSRPGTPTGIDWIRKETALREAPGRMSSEEAVRMSSEEAVRVASQFTARKAMNPLLMPTQRELEAISTLSAMQRSQALTEPFRQAIKTGPRTIEEARLAGGILPPPALQPVKEFEATRGIISALSGITVPPVMEPVPLTEEQIERAGRFVREGVPGLESEEIGARGIEAAAQAGATYGVSRIESIQGQYAEQEERYKEAESKLKEEEAGLKRVKNQLGLQEQVIGGQRFLVAPEGVSERELGKFDAALEDYNKQVEEVNREGKRLSRIYRSGEQFLEPVRRELAEREKIFYEKGEKEGELVLKRLPRPMAESASEFDKRFSQLQELEKQLIMEEAQWERPPPPKPFTREVGEQVLGAASREAAITRASMGLIGPAKWSLAGLAGISEGFRETGRLVEETLIFPEGLPKTGITVKESVWIPPKGGVGLGEFKTVKKRITRGEALERAATLAELGGWTLAFEGAGQISGLVRVGARTKEVSSFLRRGGSKLKDFEIVSRDIQRAVETGGKASLTRGKYEIRYTLQQFGKPKGTARAIPVAEKTIRQTISRQTLSRYIDLLDENPAKARAFITQQLTKSKGAVEAVEDLRSAISSRLAEKPLPAGIEVRGERIFTTKIEAGKPIIEETNLLIGPTKRAVEGQTRLFFEEGGVLVEKTFKAGKWVDIGAKPTMLDRAVAQTRRAGARAAKEIEGELGIQTRVRAAKAAAKREAYRLKQYESIQELLGAGREVKQGAGRLAREISFDLEHGKNLAVKNIRDMERGLGIGPKPKEITTFPVSPLQAEPLLLSAPSRIAEEYWLPLQLERLGWGAKGFTKSLREAWGRAYVPERIGLKRVARKAPKFAAEKPLKPVSEELGVAVVGTEELGVVTPRSLAGFERLAVEERTLLKSKGTDEITKLLKDDLIKRKRLIVMDDSFAGITPPIKKARVAGVEAAKPLKALKVEPIVSEFGGLGTATRETEKGLITFFKGKKKIVGREAIEVGLKPELAFIERIEGTGKKVFRAEKPKPKPATEPLYTMTGFEKRLDNFLTGRKPPKTAITVEEFGKRAKRITGLEKRFRVQEKKESIKRAERAFKDLFGGEGYLAEKPSLIEVGVGRQRMVLRGETKAKPRARAKPLTLEEQALISEREFLAAVQEAQPAAEGAAFFEPVTRQAATKFEGELMGLFSGKAKITPLPETLFGIGVVKRGHQPPKATKIEKRFGLRERKRVGVSERGSDLFGLNERVKAIGFTGRKLTQKQFEDLVSGEKTVMRAMQDQDLIAREITGITPGEGVLPKETIKEKTILKTLIGLRSTPADIVPKKPLPGDGGGLFIPTAFPLMGFTGGKKPTPQQLAKRKEGYYPYGKRRGKWVKLNRKAQPKTEAEDLASWRVDETVSQSFKVRKAGKPVSDFTDYPSRKYKFTYKPKRNIWVEKKKHAIDTWGERQGITLKGIAASKAKARQRRIEQSLFGIGKPRKKKTKRRRKK